jgi:hypothetical protein
LINHAVALRLQQKTLLVAVADKIWQTQLEQMRGQLLFRLNSILGQPLVTSIELLVDPVALTMFVQNEKPPEVSNQGKLNEDVISFELRSAASAIEDSRLRTAFLGAASSCLNRLEKSKT